MKNTFRNLLIVLMLFVPSLAHAQENFSIGVAMTTSFAGIGFGIDVGGSESGSSEAIRGGLWVNIPSAALQTNHFGVGLKIVLLNYFWGTFPGDFLAFYGGEYATLAIGGNSGFMLGAGVVVGLELNPIPQVFGLYAEFGLGVGIPYIVDANLTIGARIYVGRLF